jgi:hypothetical protein
MRCDDDVKFETATPALYITYRCAIELIWLPRQFYCGEGME